MNYEETGLNLNCWFCVWQIVFIILNSKTETEMDKCRRGAEGVKGNKRKPDRTGKCLSLCCVPLFLTTWTVAHQASLTMAFFQQEYWSGLPFLLPDDLLDPGIEPVSPKLAGVFFTTEPLGKLLNTLCICVHAQSCPTLCDPMDRSLPSSSVHGILQARILE